MTISEPGQWSVVQVRHDNDGDPFIGYYTNDGYYWWHVGPGVGGYSWEQLINADPDLALMPRAPSPPTPWVEGEPDWQRRCELAEGEVERLLGLIESR